MYKSRLNHELLLCTRNRPIEVRRSLASVLAQQALPDNVLVVDSSDDDETQRIVEDFNLKSREPRFVYIRSAPGLTKQRNLGVRHASAEIIHFIDDDVVLEPNYLKEILRVFEGDIAGRIGGVGGLITNLPSHRPRRFTVWAQMDSKTQGSVLPSGRNILVFKAELPVRADWLSGCSMSFRRTVFDFEWFDESLTGYSLGEDVDFTFRIRQRFNLVVTPFARVQHLSSPANRHPPMEMICGELLHRYWRVKTGIGHLSVGAFWRSAVCQAVWFALKALTGPSRHSLRAFLATIRGIRLVLWESTQQR